MVKLEKKLRYYENFTSSLRSVVLITFEQVSLWYCEVNLSRSNTSDNRKILGFFPK